MNKFLLTMRLEISLPYIIIKDDCHVVPATKHHAMKTYDGMRV